VVPTQPLVQSVQLLQAPPAEILNFHMKLSNSRSQDSKFDKIAVKVSHPQKVRSTKNQKYLTLEKTVFTDQITIKRTLRSHINHEESQKCPNLES